MDMGKILGGIGILGDDPKFVDVFVDVGHDLVHILVHNVGVLEGKVVAPKPQEAVVVFHSVVLRSILDVLNQLAGERIDVLGGYYGAAAIPLEGLWTAVVSFWWGM